MLSFTNNPEFGHITTFGGHPVSCAAALANLEILTSEKEIIEQVEEKGLMFEEVLKNHPLIKNIRRKGLLMSIELENTEINLAAMKSMLENGLITDPFFFMPNAFRIAPPLVITKEEIGMILRILDLSLKLI